MFSTNNLMSSMKWSEPCPPTNHSHRYFAYDSNLDPEQMAARCPDAKFVSRAILPNHSLKFDHFSRNWSGGVLDIIESPAEQVAGVLYEIPHNNIKKLDEMDKSYSRVHCKVYPVDADGTVHSDAPISVETYERSPFVRSEIPPTRSYLNTILRGAQHWQLPEEYIEKIQSFAESLMSRNND